MKYLEKEGLVLRVASLLFMLFVWMNLNAEKGIGLVLSGGGARGFAQIGMLKVIDEMHLPIKCVVGTSVGSIIGSLYSMGYSAEEIEQIVLSIDWTEIFSDNVPRQNVYIGQKRWGPYANYFFNLNDRFAPNLPQGFIPGNKIMLDLFYLTYRASYINNFDKLPIPFRCVSTDILTGKMKVFQSGSLAEAVRASSSIPSVFQPFELSDTLYIDGGVSENFPAGIAIETGADYVIGLKTNSEYMKRDKLKDIIDVLNQTINIGMTNRMKTDTELCDVVLCPDLSDYNSADFSRVKEIIDQGEKTARLQYKELLKLKEECLDTKESKSERNILIPMPDTVRFANIFVEGNLYLSSFKVKEYVNIDANVPYTKDTILKAFKRAHNSELFSMIYPRITKLDNEYYLCIVCQEKERKRLGLNIVYNTNDDLKAGVALELNNYLQKNSKLILNVQLGNSREVNIDYVKNFGSLWGVYFRVFPYLKDQKIYFYNDEHEKTQSVRTIEHGELFGVGFFAQDIAVLESYAFTFKTKLYRDISVDDPITSNVLSSGFGIKYYHESLDDFVFPMKGVKTMGKFNFANKGKYSDYTYRKLKTQSAFYIPFSKNFSIGYGFELGTYFNSDSTEFDPSYIGGIDNFLGLFPKEMSAPFYKIGLVVLKFKLSTNIFLDMQVNALKLGDVDNWDIYRDLTWGGGIRLGYRTPLAPLRLALATNEDRKVTAYISIGFDLDAFEFSRR